MSKNNIRWGATKEDNRVFALPSTQMHIHGHVYICPTHTDFILAVLPRLAFEVGYLFSLFRYSPVFPAQLITLPLSKSRSLIKFLNSNLSFIWWYWNNILFNWHNDGTTSLGLENSLTLLGWLIISCRPNSYLLFHLCVAGWNLQEFPPGWHSFGQSCILYSIRFLVLCQKKKWIQAQ